MLTSHSDLTLWRVCIAAAHGHSNKAAADLWHEYNPISTSLRLVIDQWHGWGVLSALAFDSAQWSRERKKKKATADYVILNIPRIVCLHSAIYVAQKSQYGSPTPIKSSCPSSSNTRTNPPVLYLITCVRNQKFLIFQVKKPRLSQVPNLLSRHPHLFPTYFLPPPPLLHANLAITPDLSFLTL